MGQRTGCNDPRIYWFVTDFTYLITLDSGYRWRNVKDPAARLIRRMSTWPPQVGRYRARTLFVSAGLFSGMRNAPASGTQVFAHTMNGVARAQGRGNRE